MSSAYASILAALQARYQTGSLTITQLATELSCNERTLYRAIDDGLIPPPLRPTGTGKGRLQVWPMPIIAAYLSGDWTAQTTQPQPEPPQPPQAQPQRKRGRPRKGEVRHA